MPPATAPGSSGSTGTAGSGNARRPAGTTGTRSGGSATTPAAPTTTTSSTTTASGSPTAAPPPTTRPTSWSPTPRASSATRRPPSRSSSCSRPSGPTAARSRRRATGACSTAWRSSTVPTSTRPTCRDKPAYIRATPALTADEVQASDASRRRVRETLLSVDEAVADILGALRDTGRLSNTLIVFASDQGSHAASTGWSARGRRTTTSCGSRSSPGSTPWATCPASRTAWWPTSTWRRPSRRWPAPPCRASTAAACSRCCRAPRRPGGATCSPSTCRAATRSPPTAPSAPRPASTWAT